MLAVSVANENKRSLQKGLGTPGLHKGLHLQTWSNIYFYLFFFILPHALCFFFFFSRTLQLLGTSSLFSFPSPLTHSLSTASGLSLFLNCLFPSFYSHSLPPQTSAAESLTQSDWTVAKHSFFSQVLWYHLRVPPLYGYTVSSLACFVSKNQQVSFSVLRVLETFTPAFTPLSFQYPFRNSSPPRSTSKLDSQSQI